jgi:osmoprotectant transport system substrate-binding protein
VVGSKTFAEARLLGYMAYEAVSAQTELSLVDEIGYSGASKTIWNGLVSGPLSVYWEYTGTYWLSLAGNDQSSLSTNPQEHFEQVRNDAAEEYGVTVLPRAPFNNSYGLAADPAWVEETGVDTISALAEYVSAGNTDVTIALGPGFYYRSDGWPGLLDHYGFDSEVVDAWSENIEVVSLGLTYEFLETDDAQIGMVFTMDGQIAAQNLVVLEDDQNFWPIYSPAPFLPTAVIEKHPAVRDAIEPIGPALGGPERMRELNAAVTVDGRSAHTVAREFLEEEGLLR